MPGNQGAGQAWMDWNNPGDKKVLAVRERLGNGLQCLYRIRRWILCVFCNKSEGQNCTDSVHLNNPNRVVKSFGGVRPKGFISFQGPKSPPRADRGAKKKKQPRHGSAAMWTILKLKLAKVNRKTWLYPYWNRIVKGMNDRAVSMLHIINKDYLS